MNQKIWGKARTKVVDATSGSVVKPWSDWHENLVFDSALNAMAIATNGYNFGGIFETCKVGYGGTAANEILGGATTFTQSGTSITANGNFFTASMIGAIFKYGAQGTSNGLEQYIVSQAGTTAQVSGSGTNVASASQGAVWFVQQTALTAWLFKTQTYVTAPGDNGTTLNGNTATLIRTFQFPVQTNAYSVSEIGYSNNSSANANVDGRIVLTSPDTITNTQFYVVQIVMTYTVSPSTPTAAANVGTGIDTTGTYMWNVWDFHNVGSSGGTGNYQNNFSGNTMDSSPQFLGLQTGGTYTLNPLTSTSQVLPNSVSYVSTQGTSWNNSGQPVGTATTNLVFNGITTAGQTVYTLFYGSQSGGVFTDPMFVLTLNTPYTLPTGAFSATFTLKRTFGRTLIN